MPTFLTTKKMAPALRARIEASVLRQRAGQSQRRSSRILGLARVGLMASLALIVLVILVGR
jgi:hypothetical protein